MPHHFHILSNHFHTTGKKDIFYSVFTLLPLLLLFCRRILSVLPVSCTGLRLGKMFLLISKKNGLHLSLGDTVKSCASLQVFFNRKNYYPQHSTNTVIAAVT